VTDEDENESFQTKGCIFQSYSGVKAHVCRWQSLASCSGAVVHARLNRKLPDGTFMPDDTRIESVVRRRLLRIRVNG
jgi:hypothetical protein